MGSVPVVLHEAPYVAGHVHAYVGSRAPKEPGGVGYSGPGEVQVWPDFTIRQRTRSGFTDEGAPVYAWSAIATGETMLYVQRRETDPDAGVTRVTATATLGNPDGLTEVMETATAYDSDGHTWRVTASEVLPTHIVLHLDRVEFADLGGQVVPDPFGQEVEMLAFSHEGELLVHVGESRWPITGGTFNVVSVAAMVGQPPVGSPVVVDVNKNGTSILEDRLQIADGEYRATGGTYPSPTTLSDGDYITVDIDSVGSTYAGADLVLVVRVQRASS